MVKLFVVMVLLAAAAKIRGLILPGQSTVLIVVMIGLMQILQVHSLRAQHADPADLIDTTGMIEFTLFPETDPFESTEPIRVSLEFDIRKLIREKHKDQYQKAVFRFYEMDGDTVVHSLKIKARGEFRKDHCHFPPIRLNFKRSELEQEYMNNINKLKLVTHCRKSHNYQQYILKEYLIYRMYNLLTENSYRVRLFIIEYRDTGGRYKPFESYGFIIESNTHLTNRLDGIILDRENIATWNADSYHANLMAIFQFMIGNVDWAIPKLHNIRLLKTSDPFQNPVAIPYDFDYTGMVNASYAIPHKSLRIESITQRIYRGYCLPSENDYQAYFHEFLTAKPKIYALVRNFELLDHMHQNEMIHYLDSFFRIIEDPRLARIHIINNCTEIPSR